MEEEILEFLGKIVAYGGGAAVIAYLIFAFLGKKTVETWFAKRLRKFEYDLSSLFNRVTKIHEKEFEVLPEAWLKMQDAIGRVSDLVSILKQWPDFDRMNNSALEEFIERSKLHEYEKQELRISTKKLDYYQKAIFWHDLDEAKQAFLDFHNYITRNQVFLSSDLQEQFMKLDNIMWSAIVKREVGQRADGQEVCISAYKQIRDDVSPVRDEIANLVQNRLHYHDVD
jgi:hypothetical protein